MCLAFPGKIKTMNGDYALVDFNGIKKEINISLISDAKIGEYIIVHAGFAIEKISNKDAGRIFDYKKSFNK